MAGSSRGLGRMVFSHQITGSNPVPATIKSSGADPSDRAFSTTT